jgi:hypothetical protein
MTIREASRKVKISIASGSNYYNAYKNDPEKKNPIATRSNAKNIYAGTSWKTH